MTIREYKVIDNEGNITDYVEIKTENGFTSMPKSVWDAQEAAKEAQSL